MGMKRIFKRKKVQFAKGMWKNNPVAFCEKAISFLEKDWGEATPEKRKDIEAQLTIWRERLEKVSAI
jgi:hypothetical protein